ncbi:MAG: hypothetical protein JXD19_01475 [Deltaproteobacteria bacterium]|nr:hypothetical protein [Deltaproteobacteria bacterium]
MNEINLFAAIITTERTRKIDNGYRTKQRERWKKREIFRWERSEARVLFRNRSECPAIIIARKAAYSILNKEKRTTQRCQT